jgi:hydrogenase maturation protein HypF
VSAVRFHARIEGLVQGVGFRPHVFGLATRLGLSGWVRNDPTGVDLEVEGAPERVAEFRSSLQDAPPPLAVVSSARWDEVSPEGGNGFAILKSEGAGGASAWISPDVAVCPDCLREMADPGDRRHRYPFINCTNCGPRYTILLDLPYDRARTTMRAFPMCDECRAEYEDPGDRRFHAQPVACAECGPRVWLADASGADLECADAIARAAKLLRDGKIVAARGLGGFHLVCDARSRGAVRRLRARKCREEKPLAVMVASLDEARELAEVSDVEAALLDSIQKPIVLLKKREGASGELAPSVAPRNHFVGLMLPYTPLHALLLDAARAPLVMTSGNLTDEPIATGNEEAVSRLAGIADAFLLHDRDIHIRTDDSVARVVMDVPRVVRRSRGYVPRPVAMPVEAPEPILAVGAELKSAIALARGRDVFGSHHIGDLKTPAAYGAFRQATAHLARVLEIAPRAVAADMHPDYLSTRWAHEESGLPVVEVQHHHAHIAACLAENGHAGSAIGIALDGVGYGPGGEVWGGEVLVADLVGYRRAGHLEPVRMPGGDAASEEPRRMAAAYAALIWEDEWPMRVPKLLDFATRDEADFWIDMARRGVNSPVTTSAGRLFDAAACALGLRGVNVYEGQAACELEGVADPAERGVYDARVERDDDGMVVVHGSDLFKAVAEDAARGVDAGAVAARFHNGLAAALARACELVRDDTGLATVALSGGVFQNALLLTELAARLGRCGFDVLTHSLVPTNDGGIAFGQAAVAAARASAGE